MAQILDDEVSKYLESLESDSVIKKEKINPRYQQYLAMCRFTMHDYPIHYVDGYTFVHHKDTKSYTLSKGKLKVDFRLMSDILKERKDILSKKSEEVIMSDEEYDELEFCIDQLDYLPRLTRRNRCHELVKTYAKDYHMKAVTGLFVPKYDGMEIYHSWLENDECCFDITNNLVFDKKAFYRYIKEKINVFTPQELENCDDLIDDYCFLVYMAAKKKIKIK